MPDEVIGMIGDCRTTLNLAVIVEHEREQRVRWDGSREDLLRSSRIFFAEEAPIDAAALADQASPARLGWVMMEIPAIEEQRLFCIQIGARGDCYDRDSDVVRDNKPALTRFAKVWKIIASQLRYPIRARNVVSGAEESYSWFGYSAGARDWAANGGQLRQR
ncbi:MAG TPA: hypothetical protein VGM88_27250 [Kofleriaceae bacterium]|jgi:hypothetical protein